MYVFTHWYVPTLCNMANTKRVHFEIVVPVVAKL